MMVAPATALGIDLLLFAESGDDSGAQISHHVVGDYTDLEAVKNFASSCDVITFEHQLVPSSIITMLEVEGIKVYPSMAVISKLKNIEKIREEFEKFPAPTAKLDAPASEVTIMVARSPHGQATTWAPTEAVAKDGICEITITPARNISSELAEQIQKIALDIAKAVGLVGVMVATISVTTGGIYIKEVSMGLHPCGNWTIDGSRTSQFEQHLRAILDLPLGDPSLTAEFAVMGNIFGGEKFDMYRPYLHLMARNPDLKFHQYKIEVRAGRTIGHVTTIGSNLNKLIEDVNHAQEYMSGVIDE
jgi:5-(carboxyamino)imidazole ribonucleotide synthase